MFLSSFLLCFFLNKGEDERGARGDISAPSFDWEDSGWTRRSAAFVSVYPMSPSSPKEQEHRPLLVQRLACDVILKRTRFRLT